MEEEVIFETGSENEWIKREHKGVTHSRLEVRTVQVDARESGPTSLTGSGDWEIRLENLVGTRL